MTTFDLRTAFMAAFLWFGARNGSQTLRRSLQALRTVVLEAEPPQQTAA
jgi:hypothetical protein